MKTAHDAFPADPTAEQGASMDVIQVLDNARRKAIRYGAYDIVVVLKCPGQAEDSYTSHTLYTVGSGRPGGYAELAQELRRVADRIYPVDEHGIGEQTRKHLTVALRDALKALEGA